MAISNNIRRWDHWSSKTVWEKYAVVPRGRCFDTNSWGRVDSTTYPTTTPSHAVHRLHRHTPCWLCQQPVELDTSQQHRCHSAPGKVTVGLESRWPCDTDFSSLTSGSRPKKDLHATYMGPRKHVLREMHTGTTWRISMNRRCATAMRQLFVKLLWPPVIIIIQTLQSIAAHDAAYRYQLQILTTFDDIKITYKLTAHGCNKTIKNVRNAAYRGSHKQDVDTWRNQIAAIKLEIKFGKK